MARHNLEVESSVGQSVGGFGKFVSPSHQAASRSRSVWRWWAVFCLGLKVKRRTAVEYLKSDVSFVGTFFGKKCLDS